MRRNSRWIPYGYRVDPSDDFYIIPIDNELKALEQAREYLNTCSYREVCNWLFRSTGRPITPMGLMKALKRGY